MTDRSIRRPVREKIPPEAGKTLRQRIREALLQNPMGAKELSGALRISEKDVIAHLGHVAKSLRPPERLTVHPPVCHQCEFTFSNRSRFTTPGRCPRCRHEGISPPVFQIDNH